MGVDGGQIMISYLMTSRFAIIFKHIHMMESFSIPYLARMVDFQALAVTPGYDICDDESIKTTHDFSFWWRNINTECWPKMAQCYIAHLNKYTTFKKLVTLNNNCILVHKIMKLNIKCPCYVFTLNVFSFMLPLYISLPLNLIILPSHSLPSPSVSHSPPPSPSPP